MRRIEYTEKFCEPVASDDTLRDPILDFEMYKDLLIERNAADLCAWAKCPNKVRADGSDEVAVFCSKTCQFLSQQFGSSLIPERSDPRIRAVVERFPDQRPPKPLCKPKPDEIEGCRVRVGPHRNILDTIERWFGQFRVFSFEGMTEAQTKIFNLVNECLKTIGAELLKNRANVQFFVNICAKDPDILIKAPKPIQMAFSLAIYEFLTDAEVRPSLAGFEITQALYDDMLGIVAQAEDEGPW